MLFRVRWKGIKTLQGCTKPIFFLLLNSMLWIITCQSKPFLIMIKVNNWAVSCELHEDLPTFPCKSLGDERLARCLLLQLHKWSSSDIHIPLLLPRQVPLTIPSLASIYETSEYEDPVSKPQQDLESGEGEGISL